MIPHRLSEANLLQFLCFFSQNILDLLFFFSQLSEFFSLLFFTHFRVCRTCQNKIIASIVNHTLISDSHTPVMLLCDGASLQMGSWINVMYFVNQNHDHQPVDTRLPLLAVMKLFFKATSPSRFIFAPPCSVRSMAISSKLLAAPTLVYKKDDYMNKTLMNSSSTSQPMLTLLCFLSR